MDSWSTVDWEGVTNRDELILARMRQLDQRKVSEELAAANLRNSRKQNKAYFDLQKRMRAPGQEIQDGDLVLVFDVSQGGGTRSRKHKLDDRWRGPYRVRKKVEDSTFYLLEELDGTPMQRKFAGNLVKRYFLREKTLRDADST